jgi:2-succinyl-6-hydroxy-2,4-cyclohexadiene-1-carboxylate synthase
LAYFIRHYCQKPVILVGYSMGARLALSLATQYPSLCKGLVLESGHFGISSETERQSRQSLDAQRADEIMSDYSSFLRYWEDISLFNTPNARAINATYKQIQQNQQPIWIANSLLGFGAGTMPSVENRLTSLRMPVLLLVGEDDSKFKAINQRMHLMLPSSYLSIIEGAGHRVNWDNPKTWQKEIELFISQL